MNILGDHSQDEFEKILNIHQEIHSCSSASHMQQLIIKYENSDHPDIFYDLGVCCFNNEEYEKSKIFFEKGVKYGLEYPNRYFNTIFSDGIGQCMFNLIKNIEYDDYNLFALAYVYLSNAVNLTPREACDSMRSRAKLINNSSFSQAFICDYLEMDVIKETLVISDYLFAGISFIHNREIQRECFTDAQRIHNWLEDISIEGKDADDYSIEEIAEIGEKRHNKLYNSVLIDFYNNKFF